MRCNWRWRCGKWSLTTTTPVPAAVAAAAAAPAAASASTTFKLAAINRAGSFRRALLGRPLIHLSWNAVLTVVENHLPSGGDSRTGGRLPSEVVEGVGEVVKAWKLAYTCRDEASKSIVGHIQLLQAPHASDGRRQ